MIRPTDRRCAGVFLLSLSLVVFLGGCTTRILHSGLTPTPHVLVRQWTLPTRAVASLDAGDRGVDFANPILDESRALIFGNSSVGVISLYPKLQKTRWKLPIKNGVVSELALHKGTVYFGGGDGFLYAVNAETGKTLWTYDLRNPVISRPTIAGGRLFVTTSDDTVVALDAATGKWLWHLRRRSGASSTVLGASAPAVVENLVIAGLSEGSVVALTVTEGQLKWQKRINEGIRFTDIDAHPVVDGAVMYLPAYDGALYSMRWKDGEVLWKFDAGGSKQVLLEGSRLFLPSSDGHVYAINKENGQQLWKFELDQGTPTRLTMDDRHLFFGSSRQFFYAVDKNTGKADYRFNVGLDAGFYGSPLYASEFREIYALSSSGNLYSFAVRQPPRKKRWSTPIDSYE